MKKGKYKKRKHVYPERINGYLYYKVIYKGFEIKRFKTEKEAEYYLAELTLKNANHSEEEINSLTFSQGVNSLLTFCKQERKSSTYDKKKQMFNDYILPIISDKPIKDITMADCTAMREYIGSMNCSTLYKNELLRLYKQVFNFVDKNYDVENRYPRKLEKFSMTDTEKLSEAEKVEEVWSPEEFGLFLTNVDSRMYKALFTYAITSWTRLGETLGIQWKDYDGHKIHVYKSVMKVNKKIDPRSFRITYVKTKNGDRIISLPDETCNKLNELKKRQMNIPGYSDSWFVFNRYNGSKYTDGTIPIARTTVNRIFKDAIKRSGVKEIRIHDLRHSGATYAILNGEDIKAVSERLGHSDIEITLRVYHHAIGQAKNKIMERMNDFAKFSN